MRLISYSILPFFPFCKPAQKVFRSQCVVGFEAQAFIPISQFTKKGCGLELVWCLPKFKRVFSFLKSIEGFIVFLLVLPSSRTTVKFFIYKFSKFKTLQVFNSTNSANYYFVALILYAPSFLLINYPSPL